MAIHIFDIPSETLRNIRALIAQGRYDTVEQFVMISLQNQLVLESSSSEELAQAGSPPLATRPGDASDVEVDTTARAFVPQLSWLRKEVDLGSLPIAEPSQVPLWGQFYRFLPLKLVLRLMINMVGERPVELSRFTDASLHDVWYLADHLRAADSKRKPIGLLSLSVGLPNRRRPERSQYRFMAQYVGLISRHGQLTGFPSAMGFILHPDDARDATIRITQAGAEFALLPNHILDEGDLSAPLSSEETHFLISYIANTMSGEKAQMRGVLRAVYEGAVTPDDLRKSMKEVYRPFFGASQVTEEEWSDGKLTLMIAGALSRLVEMGFVERQRNGSRVRYGLTGGWQHALEMLGDE